MPRKPYRLIPEIAHSRARIAALALSASRDSRQYTRNGRLSMGYLVAPLSESLRPTPAELARRRRALKSLEQARADHATLRVRLGLTTTTKEIRPTAQPRRANQEDLRSGTSTAHASRR